MTMEKPTGGFVCHLLSLAVLLRVGLFLFCVWQDTTRWPDGQLRFTDVDYDVFTDAAKALVDCEDIYEARPTYRYSPLIALIVSPCHYLIGRLGVVSNPIAQAVAYAAGKVVFIVADIVCALLQRSIILAESGGRGVDAKTLSWLVGTFWLFNPITAAVSVRGNAESFLGTCVLACLWSLLRNRVMLAGLLFGLCIHLKLYPVIYAPVIYLQLCDPPYPSLLRLPTRRHWIFGLATLVSLLGLTGAAYAAYGWRGLYHAYFYHFTRVDLWHNFAPHFYPIYLLEGILAQNGSDPAVAFYDATLFPYNHVPEWLLAAFYRQENLARLYTVFKALIMLSSPLIITVLSFRLWKIPSFAWFAITFVFVTFNKVCTSQYFLWWLVLLPPALAHIRSATAPAECAGCLLSRLGLSGRPVRRSVCLALLWLTSQGCWLGAAYLHEMQGPPWWGRGLWLGLWTASALFLLSNVAILKCLLRWLKQTSDSTAGDRKKGEGAVRTTASAPKKPRPKERVEGELRNRVCKQTPRA